jgi:excinuclease ABC subunit B
MDETSRRRTKQIAYNEKHGITPETVKKEIRDILGSVYELDYAHIPEVAESEAEYATPAEREKRIAELERLMTEAAADLRFEDAAKCRDEIAKMKGD